MSRTICVFDTTLRDGEQSPGASMNVEEKLVIARQLVRLGVDVIEAGYPASSSGDFRAVQEIGALVGKSCVVCAFSRASVEEVDRAAEALRNVLRPRISTGVSVSPIHLEHKLGITESECVELVTRIVSRARSHVSDVEFYAEDAGRADPEFLMRVVRAAVDAGATTINLADTTGYCLPEEFGEIVSMVAEGLAWDDGITISVHTHDDLGMATAASLAGVRSGATQVECAVNGLGERAGNASLEEVATAIDLRGDVLDARTNIRLSEITRTSRLVSRVTGINVQPNKAIVGANAFTHSPGYHQDAVLKDPAIYEIVDPARVGSTSSEIILSDRSGRAALRHRLTELGYTFEDDEFEDVYARFLEIAEQKQEVFDEDLESMVQERIREVMAVYTLDALQVQCGDPLVPTAVATITDEQGTRHVVSATGTGPIDASYKAIDKVVSVRGDLQEFVVKAITRGIDAIGEVVVRVQSDDGRIYTGRGSDTDIIVSSAKAYVNAINRVITTQRSRDGR